MPTSPTISPGALALASDMIPHFEGFRSRPCWDAHGSCWSIGYGFCALVDGTKVTAHMPPLSLAACELQLAGKLRKEYVPPVLAAMQGIALTDGQLAALVDFAWNLGPGKITAAGLPAMLRAGNLNGAATAMNRYVMAGGVKLAGLMTHRAENAAVPCGASWPFATAHPVAVAREQAVDDLNAQELARHQG